MSAKVSASKIGLLIVIAIAAGSASLAAQDKPAYWHITTLYAFTGNADGAEPFGGVVLDPAGNVYGTTAFGGNGGANCGTPSNCGVVFKIDPKGHESLLHTFTGYPGDGANPTEGVTRDSAGRIYGLTLNLLTLYELQPSDTVCAAVLCPWTESFLYNSEIGQLGGSPTGIPLPDGLGNFYATSNTGGSSNCEDGCGFVFKVDSHGNETAIYNFQGGSDGAWPMGPMLLEPEGSLYGTTSNGGGAGGCPNGGCGTVYRIDANGNESILYSFAGGSEGENPYSGVIADEQGNLYGTTPNGGGSDNCPFGCGQVFELMPAGSGWSFSTFYPFQGGADGQGPVGGLLRDSQGNFYGTTYTGGSCLYGAFCGTVYKLDFAGNKTTLWNFTAGTDGLTPEFGSLVMDQQGSLYGTTIYGGDLSATNPACTTYEYGCGVVFKLTP
jgi:uncharacterized repeat protein (TIGR03803 family)